MKIKSLMYSRLRDLEIEIHHVLFLNDLDSLLYESQFTSIFPALMKVVSLIWCKDSSKYLKK